ncbi:murein transglycosylase A [Aquabacterium sp. OR-4]|uniref:murein transglycosylase A n=1 Tax=Aquabacterium sp. OR-4 TaxID=2978127 RepID=UPI0021B2E8E0|nr:MltA domain-containing protein [Aquabacterium sp. OR-4]MDT7837735.1 MltA domain-containing protein [Aquabacterium sp. OR-4]
MSMSRLSRPALLLLAAAAALLAGCASQRPAALPAPVVAAPPGGPTTTAPAAPSATEPAPWLRPRARWVPVDWPALPGWQADRAAELWPALRAGCQRPPPAWAGVCARVNAFQPPDDGFAREFLQRELQPWRVESHAGEAQGLATGYFEPLVAASRKPSAQFKVPLYRAPADLASRRPYWTRQQLDTVPAARAALAGQEIAWVASALDVLVLQIQGSGRLRFAEGDNSPGARATQVRLAFAGHNDQPYRSVGRWLIDQGELKPEGANWPAIRAWGERASPARLNEMLWSNPRVVFFREEPLPEASPAGPVPGPRGAQGVPLTAGRSVAVDPQAVPYGTPLWLDTTEPLATTPLQRLVMAQDTGGAIVGAVRIDLFWGAGEQAEQQAGRMKQPLRVWALWPRGLMPPG